MTTSTRPVLPPWQAHGDGPPLLLLSGLGAKGTSWRPFLGSAARHFCVLTLDNRGAGAAAAARPGLTIRDLALDVIALLDHLELERVPVVGRSMGGMIAQELALLEPARIERLVLASTTGRCDAHLAAIFEHWARLAEAGVPARLRHHASMLWCLGSAAMADRELVEPYLRARLAGDRPADYAHQARACAAHDALDRLRTLHVPALVVAGTDDRLMPPAHAHALAAALPLARLARVPGAGHMAYLEAPAAFAREVLEFLGAPDAARHAEVTDVLTA